MTRGHSERVRAYTDLIAQEMELDPEDAARLRWAALIHDIGKLEVPEEILNKDGRPTDEEWGLIRGHPDAARSRLEALTPWLGEWALAAFEHHERWDGRGYPRGLAGEEISRAGRIVAVADAYDVMTAPRSYKPSLPAEQARAELAANAGTQFDPEVVPAFLAVSLGRSRALAGPLAWLAQLPTVLSGSVATLGTAGVGIVPTLVVGTTLALAGSTDMGTMLDEVTSLVPGFGGPDAPTEVAAGEDFGPPYEPAEQLLGAVEHTDGTASPDLAGRRASTGPSDSDDEPGAEPSDVADDPPEELAAARVDAEEGGDEWPDVPPADDTATTTVTLPVDGDSERAARSAPPAGGPDPTVPAALPAPPPTTEAPAHGGGGGGGAAPAQAPAFDDGIFLDDVQSDLAIPVTTPPPPGSPWSDEWEQMTAEWDGWENFDDLYAWLSWDGWQEWDGWQDWDGWQEWDGGWSGWDGWDQKGGGQKRGR